jgi:hypothetical protein
MWNRDFSNPVTGMLPNLDVGFISGLLRMRGIAAATSATAKYFHFFLVNIASWAMTGDAHRLSLITLILILLGDRRQSGVSVYR